MKGLTTDKQGKHTTFETKQARKNKLGRLTECCLELYSQEAGGDHTEQEYLASSDEDLLDP